MLDYKYYEGFEGEGRVRVWYDDNGNENGFVIWEGLFNTILEACYYSEYVQNGLLECFANQDGFFDDKWEMNFPDIVLEELKGFDTKLLNTKDEDIIEKSKIIVNELISFITSADVINKKIFIEYN